MEPPPYGGSQHGTVPHGDIADGYPVLGGSNHTLTHASHNAVGPSVTTVKLEPFMLLVQDQSHYSSGGGDRLLGCRFKNQSLRRDTRAKHEAYALAP